MSSQSAVADAVYEAEVIELADLGSYEHLTDLGNARRLVAQHGADLRFCHTWVCWFVWDGQRWIKDANGEVFRRTKDTVRKIYTEAGEQNEKKSRRELADWAKRSEAETRIKAMISLARSEIGIPVSPEELDADPWLLNVVSGTIDLRTGELRSHRREDLITKLAPVEFDPQAKCPRFEEFLAHIFEDSDEVIGFLQRAVGYALTGDTREQAIFVLYGAGANGELCPKVGDGAIRRRVWLS